MNMHEDSIKIAEKTQDVSYEEIQELLNLAHQANAEKGLMYATANETVDVLIKKIGDGRCFVAKDLTNGKVVGTATICPKKIDYWYHTGEMYLIKLVGIHPDYKGHGLGKRLMEKCFEYARSINSNVIVTDSAEQNLTFKKLVMHYDFKIVDCVKYKSNSFVSTVYAKWIDGNCPWNVDELKSNYQKHRDVVEKLPDRD